MSGDLHDAPNQQVVRADGSGPADEGDGGSGGSGGEPAAATVDLEAMSKAELVAYAESLGLPADGTKAELIDAIEANQG